MEFALSATGAPSAVVSRSFERSAMAVESKRSPKRGEENDVSADESSASNFSLFYHYCLGIRSTPALGPLSHAAPFFFRQSAVLCPIILEKIAKIKASFTFSDSLSLFCGSVFLRAPVRLSFGGQSRPQGGFTRHSEHGEVIAMAAQHLKRIQKVRKLCLCCVVCFVCVGCVAEFVGCGLWRWPYVAAFCSCRELLAGFVLQVHS